MQKRRLSQVFLVDEGVLKREAQIIDPRGKTVLEIGGGNGSLSRELYLLEPERLFIVEYDEYWARKLNVIFDDAQRVKVICADFLDLEQNGELKHIDIICGNIPYHISSDILFKLLDWKFEKAYIMLQKDLVERIVDEYDLGLYSRINIMVNYYFEVEKSFMVNKHCFSPVPKVDSQLLIIKRRNNKRDLKFDYFVRNIFSHKKKSLRNALIDARFSWKIQSKEEIRRVADALEFRQEKVFTLNPAKLIITYNELKKYGLV